MFPSSPFFFPQCLFKAWLSQSNMFKASVWGLVHWRWQPVSINVPNYTEIQKKRSAKPRDLAFLYLPGQKLPTFFTQVSRTQRDRVEQGAVSPCFFGSGRVLCLTIAIWAETSNASRLFFMGSIPLLFLLLWPQPLCIGKSQ